MANINKCEFIGNLGKDPVVRTLNGGKKVAEFSIATNIYWKDRNGNKQSRTDWHPVTAYDHIAELTEKYLSKGSFVYVETEHRVDITDKGQYHYFLLKKFLKLDKNSAEAMLSDQEDFNSEDEILINEL